MLFGIEIEDYFLLAFILEINIMETKVKHCANKEMLFFYHRMKQNNLRKKRRLADMAKSKLVKVNEKIAERVVDGYKKIEEEVVGGFNKITDKFVDCFLTNEGESVEEAKTRLAAEQKKREER